MSEPNGAKKSNCAGIELARGDIKVGVGTIFHAKGERMLILQSFAESSKPTNTCNVSSYLVWYYLLDPNQCMPIN